MAKKQMLQPDAALRFRTYYKSRVRVRFNIEQLVEKTGKSESFFRKLSAGAITCDTLFLDTIAHIMGDDVRKIVLGEGPAALGAVRFDSLPGFSEVRFMARHLLPDVSDLIWTNVGNLMIEVPVSSAMSCADLVVFVRALTSVLGHCPTTSTPVPLPVVRGAG